MGKHGQGQPAARVSKAGPIRNNKRSLDLSNLKVIVRLIRAAKGKGSVAGKLPPATTKKEILLLLHEQLKSQF